VRTASGAGGLQPSELCSRTVLDVYRNDPDSGLHGAAEWMLRKWDQADTLAGIDKELQATEEQRQVAGDDSRQWYINGQGQTYAIFRADEFAMGSLKSEANHVPNEQQHRRRIDRRIAIATKEVTRGQWRVFFRPI